MSNDFSPDFFEKAIVKYLTVNSVVRDRMIPYLMNKDDLKIFHSPAVRQVVSKITTLYEKYKDFPPPSTIKMELTTEEQQNIFESSIKLDLSEFNDAHLLEKIEAFYKQGKMFNILSDAVVKMQESSFDEMGDISSAIRETLSFTFDQTTGLNLFSDDSIDIMWEHFHNKDNVISSGIDAYDEIMTGGFHEKSITIFCAEANLGKSAVLCALAANALTQNKKVLYITLEMAEKKISERILANLFGIAINDISKLDKESFKAKYTGIINKLKSNLIIKEYPARSMNSNKLLALHKDLEIKQEFKADIDFIDYIGLMVPNTLKRDENTYSEQKRCTEEVRSIAMELAIPFVSAYQINRSGYGSASISMANISDSMGVAMTGDAIIMCTQTPDQKENSLMTWTIVKSRYGKNNIRITVGMDMPKMTLFNVENAVEDLNEDKSYSSETDNKDSITSFLQSRKKTF